MLPLKGNYLGSQAFHRFVGSFSTPVTIFARISNKLLRNKVSRSKKPPVWLHNQRHDLITIWDCCICGRIPGGCSSIILPKREENIITAYRRISSNTSDKSWFTVDWLPLNNSQQQSKSHTSLFLFYIISWMKYIKYSNIWYDLWNVVNLISWWFIWCDKMHWFSLYNTYD